MVNGYLPKFATIEQSCEWLQAKTGQTWLLPRLIESGLRPYVWLGNDPLQPNLFKNRPAGFQVQVMFQDDLTRLEADGTCTLTMFYMPDDQLVKMEPSGVIPLSELKFLREDIHELAVQTAPAQTATPAPVVAGKKWTPEKLAELKAYREAHTMPETADKFGISEQRIRELLPSQKPKAKPFAGLIHRMK